jgi:hypothetical protein
MLQCALMQWIIEHGYSGCIAWHDVPDIQNANFSLVFFIK